jgi:phosphoketolase
MERDQAAGLYKSYEAVLRTIVGMINHSETWTIQPEA